MSRLPNAMRVSARKVNATPPAFLEPRWDRIDAHPDVREAATAFHSFRAAYGGFPAEARPEYAQLRSAYVKAALGATTKAAENRAWKERASRFLRATVEC